MPRNDGRIEPGEPISAAFSARAWNRAQDAADRVLGRSLDNNASGVSPYAWPCMTISVANTTGNTKAFLPGFVYQFFPYTGYAGSGSFDATLSNLGSPPETDTYQNKSTITPADLAAAAGGTFTAGPINYQNYGMNYRMGVCVTGGSSATLAVRGFAMARVWIKDSDHYFARPYLDNWGSGQDATQVSQLESCSFGPCEIIAIQTTDGNGKFALAVSRDSNSFKVTYPNKKLVWALVLM